MKLVRRPSVQAKMRLINSARPAGPVCLIESNSGPTSVPCIFACLPVFTLITAVKYCMEFREMWAGHWCQAGPLGQTLDLDCHDYSQVTYFTAKKIVGLLHNIADVFMHRLVVRCRTRCCCGQSSAHIRISLRLPTAPAHIHGWIDAINRSLGWFIPGIHTTSIIM